LFRPDLHGDRQPFVERTSALINSRAWEEARNNGNAKEHGDTNRRGTLWGATDGVDLFCEPSLAAFEAAHDSPAL
jgi:hypothetical protein